MSGWLSSWASAPESSPSIATRLRCASWSRCSWASASARSLGHVADEGQVAGLPAHRPCRRRGPADVPRPGPELQLVVAHPAPDVEQPEQALPVGRQEHPQLAGV